MNITLNAVPLSTLDPRIILLDVEECTPEIEVTAAPRAVISGHTIIHRRRTSLRLRVHLEIHEPDMAQRKDICTRIASWAAPGGVLESEDRPGQVLEVSCENIPIITSAMHWTQPLTVDFIALDFPYWRAQTAVVVNSPAATAHTLSICSAGDATWAPLEIQIRCVGALPCQTINMRSPVSYYLLEGLNLMPGDLLEIGEEKGIVYIRSSAGTLLHCRAPESSDRMVVVSGLETEINIVADSEIEVSIGVRGAIY